MNMEQQLRLSCRIADPYCGYPRRGAEVRIVTDSAFREWSDAAERPLFGSLRQCEEDRQS
jgi:hypothetical protein